MPTNINIDKIHKVVYKDDDSTKIAIGRIINENEHYITLEFLRDKKIIHIYHSSITSILEQGDGYQ